MWTKSVKKFSPESSGSSSLVRKAAAWTKKQIVSHILQFPIYNFYDLWDNLSQTKVCGIFVLVLCSVEKNPSGFSALCVADSNSKLIKSYNIANHFDVFEKR